MRLQGLHHVTMITGDARANVAFYAGVLGLRLVKKTVNFDQPTAYHLYFGDEHGAPGSILTWFEFAGAPRGRTGGGMIHTLELGVRSQDALDFWERRLASHRHHGERGPRSLRFEDYDGLAFVMTVVPGDGNPPLRAEHQEIPGEYAITGVEGARAYGASHDEEEPLLVRALGFTWLGSGDYRLDGEQRSFRWGYDESPEQRGRQGAGTVHHIAWASRDDDQLSWGRRARDAGCSVTDVRDRDYFKAIYFREPRGVLFEIATLSPGFAVDEDPGHLGEELRLPAQHEHMRAELERRLVAIVNPRQA